MSRSTSSKPSGGSKSEKRTQETQGEADVDVDVSPDEVSVDVGALEVSIDTEGEASIGIEIPTPVPGVTALGGIVIDTKTGEIVEVSGGIELGQVTGLEVAISGCNITTTFYVEIPGTNIRFSYSAEGELPNCKIEEEPPLEEEPPPEEEPGIPPLPDIPDDAIVLIGIESGAWSKLTWSTGYDVATSYNKITEVEMPGTLRPKRRWLDGTFDYPAYMLTLNFESRHIQQDNGQLIYEENQNITWRNVHKDLAYDSPETQRYDSPGYFFPTHYGQWSDIKRDYLQPEQRWRIASESTSPTGGTTKYVQYAKAVVLDNFGSKPKISPPEPPKKMDKCCRESLILLEEIHKSLGCEELLDKKSKTGGFEVPRRLLAPGGKGELKHHDYLGIFESVIRIQDNLGFHPFQVNIKDTNAAAAGDQSVNLKFVSLSAALEKILYLLIDTEDDGDAHTNMLVRLAFTCVNILTTLATTSRDVETIRDGLGIGIKAKREFIDTAFDVTCGQNEQGGFDKKKKEEIDKNMEESTEAMLPYLLRIKRHAIKTTEFDDKDDIRDLLIKILYSLKGNS